MEAVQSSRTAIIVVYSPLRARSLLIIINHEYHVIIINRYDLFQLIYYEASIAIRVAPNFIIIIFHLNFQEISVFMVD